MPHISHDSLPPSLGAHVCRWIETNLVHGEGDYLGQPFKLDPFQRRIIYRLYAYDPTTLKRIVRRLLAIMPKGCGKTELVAAIGLAELAGPVLADPDTGQPTRRTAPNIPVAAASFEQADKLFGAAKVMATHENSGLAPYVEAYDTEILLGNGELGRMYRVAAVAGTNDGGLPTCFLADEIHEWTGRKARVHLILSGGLAKRDQALEVNISTPDDADPESLIGKLVAHGQRVHSGEAVDPSFVFEHYSAGDPTAKDAHDLNNPAQLREAITLATPASWVNVEAVAARWEIDRIPEHEFRRYNLGQFVRSSSRWLPGTSWEDLADLDREVPAKAATVLGFDGSYNGDSTGLIGVLPAELDKAGNVLKPPHIFVIDAWEKPVDQNGKPKPGYEDWTVPTEEVELRVDQAFKHLNVSEMAADPPGWHQEIGRWAETYGSPPVIEYRTNQRTKIIPACSKFYTAVVKGELTHDGDARLARHLRNAIVKETPEGAYITKDHRMSPRKIDLAVAAVIGFDRATSGDTNAAEPWVGVWT